MKKHLLPIIISIPLVASMPLTVLSNCGGGSSDPEPTLIYKVTLECEEGGTIEGGYYDQKTGVRWVEVEAGGKWKNTVDRIKTNPNEGMMFAYWVDEDGKWVTDDTIIDKPRTFKAHWDHADFKKDSWKHLCELIADGGLEKIKKFYNQDSFLSNERELTLLGNTYKARVIGQEHDDLADGTGKAALTFQLSSLVSDSSKKIKKTPWSKIESNYPNYINTIVRKNVDGEGTGEGIEKGDWDKSCLDLLKDENEDLYNGLKQVTKTYRYGNQDKTYDTSLFILTTKEMGYDRSGKGESFYNPIEGSTYKYWENKQDSDRILKSLDGTVSKYALVTKRSLEVESGIKYERYIYYVDTDGSIKYEDFYIPSKDFLYGINFAFCI